MDGQEQTVLLGGVEQGQDSDLYGNMPQTEEQAAVQGTAAEQGADQGQGDGLPAEGAPEAYEFMEPEGHELDGVIMDAFADVAKELNLSQTSAQKVVDKVTPVMQARQAEVVVQAVHAWGEAARNDREFGGHKLNESLSVAKKAIDTFGTPELKQLLNDSGLGNHPEIIRAFYRAGKTIREDGIVNGAPSGGNNSVPMERRLYPNM